MEISVSAQAALLAGALLLGAAVGLLYDFFRILRVRIPLKLLGALLDLVFWLAVTAALFVYAVAAGDGAVRIYLVLGVLGGATVYFLLLSRWALKLGYLLADFLGVLWRLATLPVVAAGRLCKKIGKRAKKTFHYRRKWYKIKLISREMEEAHRQNADAAAGGKGHENQKSVHPDQAGGPGAAYRRGKRPVEPAGVDSAGSVRPDAGPGGGSRPEAGQRRLGRRRGKQRRPPAAG